MTDDPRRCVPLDRLPAGRRARVCAHGHERVPPRLEELGFVPGTVVEVVRRAPLGDPIEVDLRGYRVCIRRADAATLRAATEDAPS
ncbi:MAG: ferrous iron transport protein A [bacterium]|nr:ferrous iron transport protein A [bacterium]